MLFNPSEWETSFGNCDPLEIAIACKWDIEKLIEAGRELARRNWPEAMEDPDFECHLKVHASEFLKSAKIKLKYAWLS
jgi:hypothetical protein